MGEINFFFLLSICGSDGLLIGPFAASYCLLRGRLNTVLHHLIISNRFKLDIIIIIITGLGGERSSKRKCRDLSTGPHMQMHDLIKSKRSDSPERRPKRTNSPNYLQYVTQFYRSMYFHNNNSTVYGVKNTTLLNIHAYIA